MTKPKAVVMGGWYRALPILVPTLWTVPTWLSLEKGDDDQEILEPVDPEHPALISFTSGSTGLPKGIVRSHGFLAAQNACVAKMLASPDQNERDLVAFPIFVIANLGIGTTSILPDWKLSRHDKATAEGIVALIERETISRALVPPLICETLAKAGRDPGLGTIFTGGGPIFPDVMRALIRTMPRTLVIAVYGSTEAEPIAHQAIRDIPTEAWEVMEGGGGLLAGRPIDETRIRIIDDEIVVTGDHVNKTYLDVRGDQDNKVLINGEIWHRTGDAGRLDAQNRLWLRGRLSAKSGACYPFEIEVAARTWLGVRRVALVPDITSTMLAIEGDEPSAGLWQKKAAEIGVLQIRRVATIPLDKRHRSKIDYTALRKLVG